MENLKSQVLLKAGDSVITSKGRTGVIVKDIQYLIGYHSKSEFKVLCNALNEEECYDKINMWQWSYPNKTITFILPTPLVKIGKKEFLIQSDKLTKLEKLFPVKVIYNTDPTGIALDEECVIYLPKYFCFYCLHYDKNENSSSLYKRIMPYVQAITGSRYNISILKIYAL